MNKKALRDARTAESQAKSKAKKPGSVIVQSTKPVNAVPWWRRAREDDFMTVYASSTFQVQGDSIQIQTITIAGTVTRVLNWRNVESVVAIPPLPETEESD